jgi:hypothetical protein
VGLAAAVRPFPRAALVPEATDPRNGQLLDAYLDSIRAWGDVLRKEFLPVPQQPTWGYYGLGGHTEDEVRPIAYAVLVNAFLAEAAEPRSAFGEERRQLCREQCLAALRYLTQAHVTGAGRCLDGQPWGDQWQSAMWARAAALGAWMVWHRLDGPLQLAVARMVEHEADRFPGKEPKNSEFGDTGAEENAWNALLLSLACNMLPAHPRAALWDEAARRYLYNSLSVAADRTDSTMGDGDKPVKHWVTTVNAHPDFTVENHGLVHVGYLKLTIDELVQSATHYLVGGAPVPKACQHHLADGWRVMRRCMDWDGASVYFGGNDWKLVHTQCSDVVSYAYLSLLNGDSDAAYLEKVALDVLRRIQREEQGYYNARRDLEYGGYVASGLIACFLGHALQGAEVPPVTAEQFNFSASGVTYLEHAKAIVHRTPTKFASFAWGPKRMALAMPENGSWVIWPHFASYLGLVQGLDSSARNARLETLHPDVRPDGFSVTGRLRRQPGDLQQDFACISPPGDWLIYVERWTAPAGQYLAQRETGVIGLEYPLGGNERHLTTRQGTAVVAGIGGKRQVRSLASDWLNIDDQVGYIVCRQPGRVNVMRHHDEVAGSGRVPVLQEWISLVGDPEEAPRVNQDWACIVTCLNQPAQATARIGQTTSFEVDEDTAVCRVSDIEVRIDFRNNRVALGEP